MTRDPGDREDGERDDPERDDPEREDREHDDAEPLAEFDQEAFEAAFAAEFGATVEPERPGAEAPVAEPTPPQDTPQRRIIAVVLTPIRSAAALAGLCAMSDLRAHIIPSANGALAARTITGEVDDAEMLLTGAPSEAVQLAEQLSRLAKAQVVLLTANLGSGDDGPTGTITGREYINGEAGREVPAGLILANADDVLESLLIGTLDPEDAPGRIDPATGKWRPGGGLFGSRRRKKP
ncbi:MAG TPA: hypothetical protein VK063_05275 [Beutenbergiaceae bacterium]|nr:hypothetical protein [Beutenbergiaceae bacterium]